MHRQGTTVYVIEAVHHSPFSHPDAQDNALATNVLQLVQSVRMNSQVEKLHSRARDLFAKFERGEGTTYVDKAIELDREALKLCPPPHHKRRDALTYLANHLGSRSRQLGETWDLDEAIILFREALSLCPLSHPERPISLHNLAASLSTRHKQLGTARDLGEAVILYREALTLLPSGHANRPITLSNLTADLYARYEQLGAMQDLDEAIVLCQEALKLWPEEHPCHSIPLNDLAANLRIRYGQLGSVEDLDVAIVLNREALSHRPKGHPERCISLNNLAADLHARYEHLSVMEDLDEAIVLDREALTLRLEGHPDRSHSLINLANDLSTRYNQLGFMQDLNEAIVLGQEALSLRPEGHPNRCISLNNLAANLRARYEGFGDMGDLDDAIVLNREALTHRPKGHPNRCISLNNLAADLHTRYEHLGVTGDLNEAIILDREALSHRPKGHRNRCVSLNNLAVDLRTRYKQLGALRDLDEAIALDREALSLRPEGRPSRSSSLNNLAVDLRTRYQQLGAIQDLDEAIILDREALSLQPEGHPDRCISLNGLATNLRARYEQLGAMEDLDEATVLDREALGHRPKGHPNRCVSLSNLAADLHTRYEHLGGIEDLDEAIVLDREALGLRPEGHPNRFYTLNNLANDLSTRYKDVKVMRDLNEAIILNREALGLCFQRHPARSRCLDCLTRDLLARFTSSKNLHDKEELFSLYAQLADISQFVSSTDISAVRAWICAAETFQHPTLLLAHETVLQMLIQHLTTLPSSPQHHVILKKLTSSLAVDAFSAYLRSHAPARAVELVEQGRGVFWNQLTRLHSPLQDVVESGPAGKTLADEFSQLALRILDAVNAPDADQHERLWSLNIKMQEVVANIRMLPSLSRFLLPPLFSDLQCAASGGPVIILNASEYSCDALIVFHDRDPVHIPLQITQENVQDLSNELRTLTVRAKRADMTRELAHFLRNIWNQITSPIVEILQTIVPFRSRIWWCPTADFTTFPLHAAGPYRKGQRNLPDLYISSYTPTLATLIRARRCDTSTSTPQEKCFIAIGQAKAVGENELLSVGAELANIGLRVSGLATFTRMDGEESCIARVVEEFGRNEWVHLACHGLPNPTQPFESAFALHDGRFTIQRIIGCKLNNPEFAYLSACHTTVGDKDSPDEVIHLASAMQFIGFRSVIGTMWAVDDGETNKITSTFYRFMVGQPGRLDHTRAAYALNKTMKIVNIPFDQRILYIHLGA